MRDITRTVYISRRNDGKTAISVSRVAMIDGVRTTRRDPMPRIVTPSTARRIVSLLRNYPSMACDPLIYESHIAFMTRLHKVKLNDGAMVSVDHA